MADQASNAPTGDELKGKGKSAIPEESDVSMMDEDEQSEESEPEAQVSAPHILRLGSEHANQYHFCRTTMVRDYRVM